MGLATNLSSLAGTPLPLGEAAERIYNQVIQEQPVLAKKDFSSVYQYLKKLSEQGKKVRVRYETV